MQKLRSVCLLFIVSLLIPLTTGFAQSQKLSTSNQQDIQERLNSLANAIVNNDYATVEDFYTDDAISMPNYGKMLKGKDAIHRDNLEFNKSGMKITSLDMKVTDVLGEKGDMANAIGNYTISLTGKDGKEIKDAGNFLSVLEKKDGKWKIRAEIWNTNHNPMMGNMHEDDMGSMGNMKQRDNMQGEKEDTTKY
jgi:uncharacterized protein (TIGR02246 family)